MLKLTIKRVLFFGTYFSPFSFPAPRHHAKPHLTNNAPKTKDILTGSLFNLAPKYKAKTGVIIVINATVLALNLCKMKKQAKNTTREPNIPRYQIAQIERACHC